MRGFRLWQLSAAVTLLALLLGVGAYVAIHRLTLSRPPTTSPAAPETDPQALARHAGEILRTNCHQCHGQGGAMEGGFNYVADRQRLVDRRKLVPGQPEQSKLLRRILDGEMPPEGEPRRPTAEEVAVLRRWIEAGAPDFAPSKPGTQALPLADLPKLLGEDLARLPQRDRRFARYFTLTHLQNAGLSEDELQTHRRALSKLVNSLSWGRNIVAPHAVDPAGTVFRIDLRDYKWDGAIWERILNDYPYGATSDAAAAREMAAATDCRLPHVRADWFTAAAARPPLYYDLLQMPATDRELEALLRVDAARDIHAERVVRAGFNNSGVSRNNRIIERYESSYGAYWKSYDFAAGPGPKNIFANPLGPGGGANAFQHDGGELIFELPNGLHAYALVNAGGKRIDQAPTAIVSDPRRPERAVVAGLSCLSCHSRGLNDKADQVRDHVRKNPGAFSQGEADAVLALYAPRDRFESVVWLDTDRYRKALEQTGTRWGLSDPIETLAARFEADVDLSLAAAEVGVSSRELADAIVATPELGRSLGSLRSDAGTAPRRLFADSFGELLRVLRRGSPLRPGGSQPLPSTLKERTVVDVPGGFADVKAGGGGRFLILYRKGAKKLAILDIPQGKIVHEIDVPSEDVRFAAGRDKLIVALPGEKVIQRYDLRTFQREKVVPAPDGMTVTRVRMGYDSTGPLALWGGDKVIFLDVQRMEPLAVEGPGIGGSAQGNFSFLASPDGQVFVAWRNAMPTSFTILRLNRPKELQTLDGGPGWGERWLMPNANGSLFFGMGRPNLMNADLKPYSTDSFNDWRALPTGDPRFFLALGGLQASICTSSDRQRVLTITDKAMDRMNASSEPARWYV